jgi:hypothetical protein
MPENGVAAWSDGKIGEGENRMQLQMPAFRDPPPTACLLEELSAARFAGGQFWLCGG